MAAKRTAAKAKRRAAAKAEPPKDALVPHLGWVKAAPKLSSAVDPKKMPALIGAITPLDEDTTAILLRALGAAKCDAKFDAVLRRETTSESRDALGEALLEVWQDNEFHGRLGWIADAVGSLAGERSLSALATRVAEWPENGDTGRKRAIAAMEIFAHAGTDGAVLALMGLRQTVVLPSVLEAAIAALDVVVKRRKTTSSELFDAVTPALGLDANGTRTFTHGKRTFTVTFDDHFEPRLRSAEGELADLDDEPAWTSLAAQLRQAVKVQTFRLEHDMIHGRRWTFDAWTKALRDHPLLVSFTRRLVWGAWDEKETLTPFRTAEDRSLLHLDDPATIPPNARIGVLHPLHLDRTSRQLWAQNLADYEIIQPFPQIGRPTYVLEESERGQTKSARYAVARPSRCRSKRFRTLHSARRCTTSRTSWVCRTSARRATGRFLCDECIVLELRVAASQNATIIGPRPAHRISFGSSSPSRSKVRSTGFLGETFGHSGEATLGVGCRMANLVDTLEKTYAVKAPKRYRTFIEKKEYEKHPSVELSGYISGPYDLDFTDELLADVKELGMNAGIDDMDDVPWDEDFSTWIPIASMTHPDVQEPKMFLVLDTENGGVAIFHQDGWKLCPVNKSFSKFIDGLPEATCKIGASDDDDED